MAREDGRAGPAPRMTGLELEGEIEGDTVQSSEYTLSYGRWWANNQMTMDKSTNLTVTPLIELNETN